MKVISIKTDIVQPGDDLFKILDNALSGHSGQARMTEQSVLAVSSKIVAICEGRVVKKISDEQKDELIEQESEMYVPREENAFQISITITHNILAASAGIDESNANGKYILWPKDPQESTNRIRQYLVSKFHLTNIGVILTDSISRPLRWGVTGICLAYSGFAPLNDLIGKPDLFGRPMEYTKVHVADSLATAATLAMGERNEQTPLAIITDIPQITFQDRNPTKEELDKLQISIDEDVYGSFLKNAKWRKGRR